MTSKPIFHYGQDQLTPAVALAIARSEIAAIIPDETHQNLEASFAMVQKVAKGKTRVYGINTGFGPLCQTRIDASQTRLLQLNLLKSHSSGIGEPLPIDISKLMLITKLHSLCLGYSGIAPRTVDRILWHIEHNVIPVVPEQGSVGASGDLAPLAHLFLPLVGLGEVWMGNKPVAAHVVLDEKGIEPLTLGAKEGLALINGTQFIQANAIAVLEKFKTCLDAADIIGALSLDTFLGSTQPFREEMHQLRPHKGAIIVAQRLRKLLEGSLCLASHTNCSRVQDPYSLRCMPQVHGASRDAWQHLLDITITELNSITDNPVILDTNNIVSGGNFHGQPMALPLDYGTLAASELGNISERRTYLLLSGQRELPPFLMKYAGLNSGFMIPQYTAAALTSENKSLCFPASADSIPTSIGQEDHVSMGSISARKALRVLDNLEKILAIELVCAAQALDLRRPLKSSPPLEACHSFVRAHIPYAEHDRVFATDLEMARKLVASGGLMQIVSF